MSLLKKKSLLWMIILNIIVISIVRYINFSNNNSYLQVLLILPWILLLPINTLYISKLLYFSSKRRVKITSRIITYISFLIIIDPGISKLPGELNWLMKYESIQYLSANIPFFFFFLWWIYIIISDILLRFIWNKINNHINKRKQLTVSTIPQQRL